MKINHKLINMSALARAIGMSKDTFNGRLRNNSFSPEDKEKIKEAFIEMICYIFEVNDVLNV